MTLDLKYRPKDFDEILGNEKEIKTLITNLEKPDGSHAFIVTGPPGCGKTTIARIAASYVGADVIATKESNTGNDRGVEAIRRNIIDQMRYSMGGATVFIIDEAHGLTKDAKRALLKPTEEPPEHVYFFFLTTDPQELFKGDEGKALKTRLEPIKVNPVKSMVLYKYLRKIAKWEEIENVSLDLLKQISEQCKGSPRDALKMLSAIKDIEDEEEQLSKLENWENTKDPEIFEFCRALFSKNVTWKTLANFLLGFKESKDPEVIRRMVMGYAQSVLLKSGQQKAGYILECFCDYQYSSGFPGITLATYQAINGE